MIGMLHPTVEENLSNLRSSRTFSLLPSDENLNSTAAPCAASFAFCFRIIRSWIDVYSVDSSGG